MEFIIILLLLVMNGVFALYEMALVSVNKTRLETQVAKGNKRAQSVLSLLEEPEKTLSTIQIGITLIGIISGAFGGVAIADNVEPLFTQIEILRPYASNIAMIATVAVITYLSLVIGELVPKTIALNHPERWAMMLTPFINILTLFSYPFVWLLSASTKFINRLIGIKESNETKMTPEELKMILHQSSQQGVIDQENSRMLKDVFRFSDRRVNELMTIRRDMVFLQPDTTRHDLMTLIAECRYSKYPLIDTDTDEVLGIVSVKDAMLMMEQTDCFDLKSIAQPAFFIPEHLHVQKLLTMFREEKEKFAVVVNEYGNVEGIITLHDLAESIFGDFQEENEQSDPIIVKREDGSLLVDASMCVDDFMEEIGVLQYDELKKEDFTTLGGMTMFMIGRIPHTSDKFTYRHLQFEVVDMDRERVDKLLVTINNTNSK